MSFSLKKILNPSPSTASIVDGHLILSLPNAADPVIWRMALDKIGTATFGIKSNDDSAATKLILKPKKGTAEIIATFDNKENAVTALMLTSDALQAQTTSKSTPAHADQPAKSVTRNASNSAPTSTITTAPNTESQKWFIAILGALIVLGLYYYLTTLIPNTTITFDDQSTTSATTTQPQSSTGVPVSADDFLNGL